MTPEALEEWRAHPVTMMVKAALRGSLDQQRASAEAAYWSGNAWPDVQRLALLRSEVMWEDMFEATAENFERALKMEEASDPTD